MFKTFLSKNVLDFVFLIFTGVLIVMGSVGIFKVAAVPFSLSLTLFYLGINLIKGNKILLPPNFKTYVLFLFSILVHSVLFDGKIIYFWMFLSGGLFWLSVYNAKDLTRKYFYFFVVGLGGLMTVLFIGFRMRGVSYLPPDNLFLPAKPDILHNHIGDLWAVILIPSFYLIATKFKTFKFLIIVLGILMVGLSLSRSAVVSLVAGLMFMADYLQKVLAVKLSKNTKKLIAPAILIISMGFLIHFSIFKPILSARPYFLEALTSLIKYPLGTGMGNFTMVSAETNIVHNLVLEVVSGMGVFSVIFIYWLYKTFKDIFSNKNNNIVYKAVWLAIFVNFFFDTTYVIPGMLWIFYIVLALI